MSSAEFLLMVECCRYSFAGAGSGGIREQDGPIDWDRFIRLVRYHRVQGLVWNCLRSTGAEVPAHAAGPLSADTVAIAAANKRASAEAGELLSRFEAAGVAMIFVKGLTAGALAYPKPFLKMCWDIDILIGEKHVGAAAGILEAIGYQRSFPQAYRDLTAWHRRHKESGWSKPDQGLFVELHTRLSDNRSLIPGIGMYSPRRQVALEAGLSLPTLAEDELFAYLCVHGASSLWFRLKWITDLAGILNRIPAHNVEHLYKRSQQLGAGRAGAQALLHADDLYGSLRGTGLRARLERNAGSRWLAALAMQQVAGRAEPREPTSAPLGTAAIHLSQLLLLPGLRFKLGEAVRQLGDALQRS